MAKRQGLWRPKPAIDQTEFEAAQLRVAARLADLFGLEAPASDREAPSADSPTEADEGLETIEADSPTEVDSPTEADEGLEAIEADSPTEVHEGLETAALDPPHWRRAARPAIEVDEQPDLVDLVAEPARAEPDLVDGRARPDEPVTAAAVTEPVTAARPSRRPRAAAAVPEPTHPNTAVSVARRSAAVSIEAVSAASASRRRKAPAGATEPHGLEAGAKQGPPSGAPAGRPATRPTKAKAKGKAAASLAVATASCPYCAVLLQPPPASSQRCAHCRQRIIVKRVAGRAAYLTEAAVLVFEAERRRLGGSGRLTRERERWLKLAAAAGAPPERVARLAAAQLSGDLVDGARTLYLTAVERSFQVARREQRWEDAARIRREHALTLYRVAGSPVPPPADIVKIHRDGVAAELRGLAEITRDAELVGATCCDACRADDGQVLKIAAELRVPRLPHDGCPKGLCQCGWDLAARQRAAFQRYLRPRARASQRPGPGGHPPTA